MLVGGRQLGGFDKQAGKLGDAEHVGPTLPRFRLYDYVTSPAACDKVDVDEVALAAVDVDMGDEGVLLVDVERPVVTGFGLGVVRLRLRVGAGLDGVREPGRSRLDVQHQPGVGIDHDDLTRLEGEVQRLGGADDPVQCAGTPPFIVDHRCFDGDHLEATVLQHRPPGVGDVLLLFGADPEGFTVGNYVIPRLLFVDEFADQVGVGATVSGEHRVRLTLRPGDDLVSDGFADRLVVAQVVRLEQFVDDGGTDREPFDHLALGPLLQRATVLDQRAEA